MYFILFYFILKYCCYGVKPQHKQNCSFIARRIYLFGGGDQLISNHEIMLCLTLSGDVYFFVPNIVHSILFCEQHSLIDARDNNKSNQTYFYKNSVRFTTASAFLFSGPFYPTRMDHIMDHPVGYYFSLYFLNKAIERNKFCMIMIVRHQPLNR